MNLVDYIIMTVFREWSRLFDTIYHLKTHDYIFRLKNLYRKLDGSNFEVVSLTQLTVWR